MQTVHMRTSVCFVPGMVHCNATASSRTKSAKPFLSNLMYILYMIVVFL